MKQAQMGSLHTIHFSGRPPAARGSLASIRGACVARWHQRRELDTLPVPAGSLASMPGRGSGPAQDLTRGKGGLTVDEHSRRLRYWRRASILFGSVTMSVSLLVSGALPATAQADTEVTIGSNDVIFSQNKQ